MDDENKANNRGAVCSFLLNYGDGFTAPLIIGTITGGLLLASTGLSEITGTVIATVVVTFVSFIGLQVARCECRSVPSVLLCLVAKIITAFGEEMAGILAGIADSVLGDKAGTKIYDFFKKAGNGNVTAGIAAGVVDAELFFDPFTTPVAIALGIVSFVEDPKKCWRNMGDAKHVAEDLGCTALQFAGFNTIAKLFGGGGF